MALVLSISQGSPASPVVVNQTMNFVVTVTNSGSSSVSLTALTTGEASKTGALVDQPVYLNPGQPPGSASYPVLAASGSLSALFQVVPTSPNGPGVSPNNPGGAAPGQRAEEANAQLVLQAQAQSSDGSTASVFFTVPVLSAVAPFPVPQGGAAQFAQGANSNLIAVI